MAWYPIAVKRPITHNLGSVRRSTRGIILHVDGGNAASLAGFFDVAGRNASSHFYVTRGGIVEQYADTDRVAWTSGAANDSTIGIETQGTGDGEWTDAQLVALAKLIRWLARQYGIPIRTMTSSRPGAHGIGTHRLGVDGNFPASGVQRGRRQRAKKGLGQSWSSSTGKVCPGNKRQAQWPHLIRLAQTHVVVKKTAGRKGAAAYKTAHIGAKNITRVLPVGKEVRIVRIGKRGRWTRTLTGDRIKAAKIEGKNTL